MKLVIVHPRGIGFDLKTDWPSTKPRTAKRFVSQQVTRRPGKCSNRRLRPQTPNDSRQAGACEYQSRISSKGPDMGWTETQVVCPFQKGIRSHSLGQFGGPWNIDQPPVRRPRTPKEAAQSIPSSWIFPPAGRDMGVAQNETIGADRRFRYLCFHLPGVAHFGIPDFLEPQPHGRTFFWNVKRGANKKPFPIGKKPAQELETTPPLPSRRFQLLVPPKPRKQN